MQIKTNENDKIYLSIDFEDFSHDFKRRLGLTKNNNINEKALWRSYEIINNFLETKLDSAKITFFCTGILATKCPDLIKKISNDGHEIACHGYGHIEIFKQSYNSFKLDVQQSKDMLEQIIGEPIAEEDIVINHTFFLVIFGIPCLLCVPACE